MLSNIGGHDYDEGDMMADMICCKDKRGCSCCLVMIEVVVVKLMKARTDMIYCMTLPGE